ncbi:MAG: hypothetical protein JNL24_13615 [Bacteroidia bacterium]|nr:hypothetical protein [Bacteroidia bacterium]
MKKAKKLKLIDGDFSSKETLDILLNLYSSKVKYHELKNLSSRERYGKDDPIAIKRIPELKKGMEIIEELLSTSNKKDKFTIKSYVNISFNKKN